MTHELRRADREITDPQRIEEILSAAKYTTIALADGDQPYVVTLSFGYDRERARLCFHTARAGYKLDIIAKNPRACATVVADNGYLPGECAHPFESVVMFGRMRVLEEPADIRAAMSSLIGQLEEPDRRAEIWDRNKLDTDKALGAFNAVVFEIESCRAKKGQ